MSFGHLFVLGVVMGMVPPLPLYFIMTWYIIMVSIFIYGAESGHYNVIGDWDIWYPSLIFYIWCFCII